MLLYKRLTRECGDCRKEGGHGQVCVRGTEEEEARHMIVVIVAKKVDKPGSTAVALEDKAQHNILVKEEEKTHARVSRHK